jgi:hypothetical protein
MSLAALLLLIEREEPSIMSGSTGTIRRSNRL